jgi:hypothetical protein
MIEEFQRLAAQFQNGGILELVSGKQLFVRQLGHARSTLHMVDLPYFDYLFGINHEENTAAFPSYADDQGNKVRWEMLVDEIKTRRESWTEQRIKGMKSKTLLRVNVGLGRPDAYPYNVPNPTEKIERVPFRSGKWDHWGTRFFPLLLIGQTPIGQVSLSSAMRRNQEGAIYITTISSAIHPHKRNIDGLSWKPLDSH